MKNIPTQKDNPKGLHQRYYIQKVDGYTLSYDFFGNPIHHPSFKDVDPEAEYFVMRLDSGGKDRKHIAACRKAVLTYAEEIKDHLPELSKDLIERYSQ